MRILDIITGKARRERKEAEARAELVRVARVGKSLDGDGWRRTSRFSILRREEPSSAAPVPDITSPLNPANPFYGTGYGVTGHHSAPDCSSSSLSSISYGGDSGGSCGGGDGGGGGGGGD